MSFTRVRSYKSVGYKTAYDIEVNHPRHNFVANGLVTSNSHSHCYAVLAAQCMYLKTKHTQEFFTALLQLARFEPDTYEVISLINRELPSFGIELLPPDLVRSENDFSIDGENIRFGLSTIKGIKDKSLESLNSFLDRNTSNKYDVFVAAKESGLNVSVLCSLIQAGTLTSMGSDRVLMVAEAQFFNLLTDREKNHLIPTGEEFDFKIMTQYKAWYDEKRVASNGKPLITEKRLQTITKNFAPYKAIYTQNKQYPKFADWWFETALLGLSYSQKLSEVFKEKMYDSAKFERMYDRKTGRFVGRVANIEKRESRAGNTYYQIDLVDELGGIHAKIMDTRRKAALSDYFENGGEIPKKDDILVVYGSKSAGNEQFRDSLFIDSMSIVNQYIAMRFADIANRT